MELREHAEVKGGLETFYQAVVPFLEQKYITLKNEEAIKCHLMLPPLENLILKAKAEKTLRKHGFNGALI